MTLNNLDMFAPVRPHCRTSATVKWIWSGGTCARTGSRTDVRARCEGGARWHDL